MSGDYLATMLALGVVGFDPAIALVALASALAGVRGRVLAWFLGTALAGTLVLGVVLALTAGRALAELDWQRLLRGSGWAALVEAVLAVGGAGWVVVRVRAGHGRPADGNGRRTTGSVGVAVGFALLLVVAWVVDPGFVAAVVAAGNTTSPVAVVVGMVVWLVVAQCLTIAVAVALTTQARDRFAARFSGAWTRIAPYRRAAVTVVIGGLAAAGALDAAWYAVAGRYLVG